MELYHLEGYQSASNMMMYSMDTKLTTGHLLTLSALAFWVFPRVTDAMCSEEQAHICRRAGQTGNILASTGGGTCMAKQYVTFTHICHVHTYIPSNEYCCCANEQNVMCCRYHQEWNHFRCAEAEDVVHTFTETSIPLHIVLPCVLGGAAVILICCGFCIYKCYEHHKEISDSNDPDYDIICPTSCCCKQETDEDEKHQEKEYPSANNNPREEQQLLADGAPLTARQFSVHEGSIAELLPPSASAPPEHLVCSRTHGMHRHPSGNSMGTQYNQNVYGRQNSMASQISTTCPTCSSNIITIPPPSYEEHVNDLQVD